MRIGGKAPGGGPIEGIVPAAVGPGDDDVRSMHAGAERFGLYAIPKTASDFAEFRLQYE
jgi:hypothetical protein